MCTSQPKESLTYWEKRWVEGAIKFHCPIVHPFLCDNFQKLTGENVSSSRKILVPFCGKTLDMKYLYDNGLSVVGVDFSALAVESFFKEHSLTYDVNEYSDGVRVFKHDDRLIIIQGDLFKVTTDIIGGVCDLHWDRGALVAAQACDQQKYINHIKYLLSPNSVSLMEMVEYDTSKHKYPAQCIPPERLKELFGNDFIIEELSRVKNDDMAAGFNKMIGITHAVYIIKQTR